MSNRVYHAAPACRSFAPGRTFCSLREATAFAVEAAGRGRVAYVLWQSHAGVLRRLATYHPDRRPA
jgi:hypothetical protein